MKQIYLVPLVVFCGLFVLPATAQQATSHGREYMTPQRYKDFRFSVGGGYAFRPGKIEKRGDSQYDDMNKKLLRLV